MATAVSPHVACVVAKKSPSNALQRQQRTIMRALHQYERKRSMPAGGGSNCQLEMNCPKSLPQQVNYC